MTILTGGMNLGMDGNEDESHQTLHFFCELTGGSIPCLLIQEAIFKSSILLVTMERAKCPLKVSLPNNMLLN